jgi:hypothetical protein
MSDQPQTKPQDIVAAYLSACVPPAGCTTAQVIAVTQAWNEVCKLLSPVEKPAA